MTIPHTVAILPPAGPIDFDWRGYALGPLHRSGIASVARRRWTSGTLVIVSPDHVYFVDLLQQQFKHAAGVEVIVDRRRRERRIGRASMSDDRRRRDRRQESIRAELREIGWAITRRVTDMPPDPTRPWELPWLRVQLLLRMLGGTRWDAAVRATAMATLRDALAVRARIQREGWFN